MGSILVETLKNIFGRSKNLENVTNLGSSRILVETRIKLFGGTKNWKTWLKLVIEVHPGRDEDCY